MTTTTTNNTSVRSSKPFWIEAEHDFIASLASHPRIIHADLASNNNEYDIIIIGTGISGVSCAYWLRKLYPVERFPRILLLEKNPQPCSGASGRNGGFLWPSYDYLAGYTEDFGLDMACAWVEFQHENARAIAETVRENAIDCDLNLTRGNVALARTDEEWNELVVSYDIIKKHVAKHPKSIMSLDNVELWEHDKCTEMVHSDKFIGGLFMRESGTLWPAKFVYSLLDILFRQAGIDLILQGKVIRIEDSSKVILESGAVLVARQAIVHAANAYTISYLDFARGKMIPVRNQCSRSKPMETIFWPFGLSARDGREYYHQSPSDGRIILGGCRWRSPDTEFNNQNDQEINELISEVHEQFFAQWHSGISKKNLKVEIEQEWSGILSLTVDHLPLIGPLPGDDKQFLLGGYNGNGMPNAFLCAKAVARMIAKDDPCKEGEEKNSVSFLKQFLPQRFVISTLESEKINE